MSVHVVVLGAGYGGLRAALELEPEVGRSISRLTLIDRLSDHQLIIWLHRVAVGTVRESSALLPIKSLIAGRRIEFLRAEASGIDLAGGSVATDRGAVPYDRLVLAAGGDTPFYGIPGLKVNALTLRLWRDVERFRSHLHSVLAEARQERDPQRLKSLLTFVIGGGGHTGCELSSELAVAFRDNALGELPAAPRVILVEAAPRILGGMDEPLATRAVRIIKGIGVEIRTGAPVAKVSPGLVTLATGEEIEAGTIVWAGGICAPAFVKESGLQVAAGGRATVNQFLESTSHPEVTAIGDACFSLDPVSRKPIAPTAQLAIQQGKAAASNILADLAARPKTVFRPRPLGEIMTLGPRDGVARAGGISFSGPAAILMEEASVERYMFSLGGLPLALRFARGRIGGSP